jgi:hypothetical protein
VNPKAHEGLASEAMVSRFLHARGLDAAGLAFSHVEQFIRTVSRNPPEEITLDIDGYDAEVYGCQQLSLWNGHYEETMYYPVVVTAAEHGFALAGRLRPGGAGSGADAVPVLRPVLKRLREALPGTRIVVRADSGFMDPELYDLCEEFGVGYLIRLRMNEVLKRYFRGGLRAPRRGAAPRDARPEARALRRGPLRRGVVAEETPHRDEAAV